MFELPVGDKLVHVSLLLLSSIARLCCFLHSGFVKVFLVSNTLIKRKNRHGDRAIGYN